MTLDETTWRDGYSSLAEAIGEYAEKIPQCKDLWSIDDGLPDGSARASFDVCRRQLFQDLWSGMAWSRGRLGSPAGAPVNIPSDFWANAKIFDLKSGFVGLDRNLPNTCFFDVHLGYTPFNMDCRDWEYFNTAMLRLARKHGVSKDSAEDIVRSGVYLSDLQLVIRSNEKDTHTKFEGQKFTSKCISVELSRIFPGAYAIEFVKGNDAESYYIEAMRYPEILLNFACLEEFFYREKKFYKTFSQEYSKGSEFQDKKTPKQFDRVSAAFENLDPKLRDAPSAPGWLSDVTKAIAQQCPDIKDLPRVLRDVLKARGIKLARR